MLCSVMIPSRKRPTKLIQALTSVIQSAKGTDYELLVRLDDDDTESLEIRPLLGQAGVRVFVGPRLGYSELDIGYYAGLEQKAVGEFVWIAGDDMEVIGDWLGELRKVPKTGYIVQPEISRLCGSTYPRAEAQAFPIFPRFCWKAYVDKFPRPFDTQGDAILKANGWKTWFLEGVTMHHHEDTPENLAVHRKMETPCST